MTIDEMERDLAIITRSQDTMQTHLEACQRDPLNLDSILATVRIRRQIDDDLNAARTRLQAVLSC